MQNQSNQFESTTRTHQNKSSNYSHLIQYPSKNIQYPTLFSMLGDDKLLRTFDPYKQTLPSKQNRGQLGDRFIPNRKIIQNNYKLKQSQLDQQNFEFKDPQRISIAEIYSEKILGSEQNLFIPTQIQKFKNHNILQYQFEMGRHHSSHQYSTPINILDVATHRFRKIVKTPCKVLDAPALQDDFYLNLIDWSSNNQLAVGLDSCIYLWNADTSKVTKLCDLQNDSVTSVAWSVKGSLLSIGCKKGNVLVWDINQNKQIRKFGGHSIRVGAMSWKSNLLATGSRDKLILQRDMRSSSDYVVKLQEHKQQICGLKWSNDQQYLASGGNDNKVVIWTQGGKVLNKFVDHRAAVKALAWSPHQHGFLATGGGTADRMIRIRNVFTGEVVCEKDAGSQVCNLAFSKSLYEIVSTHGYSQNQINLWSYPKMYKVASLTGHTHRVLFLATSPDGSTIVTGAGDQTLRFWNIFPSLHAVTNIYTNKSLINQGITLK